MKLNLFPLLLASALALPCVAQEADPAPEKAAEGEAPEGEAPEGEAPQDLDADAPEGDDGSEAGGEDAPDKGGDLDGGDLDGDLDGPGSASKDLDTSDLDSDLERLLEDEVASAASGSFGYRLTQYGIDPYVHAYLTFDYVNFERDKTPNTFDMHYFNIFIGANIQDTIVPELQIEYEHGSEEIAVRFAQVDIRLHELLSVRAGLWLVPFGTYNEFLYPEFLSKTPRGPILDGTLRNLIPVAWNDVGVQLRGRYKFSEEVELNYVAYVSNGLEQEDDATTPQIEDGGGIRGMRGNFRDKNSGRKSVGGRAGFKGFGIRLGSSIYHGAYTEDGDQEITFYGLDGAYDLGGFQVGFEAVYVHQRRATGVDLHRRGVFAWVSYRFERVLGDAFAVDVEPVIAIDWVRLGNKLSNNRLEKAGNRRGYIGGVNIYPFPQVLPNLNWRFFYAAYDQNGTEVRDNIFMSQLTLGF